MRFKPWIASVLMAASLLGCATGEQYQKTAHRQPAADEAAIYLYRPSKTEAKLASPVVMINDETSVRLLDGGYSVIYSREREVGIFARKNALWAFDDFGSNLQLKGGHTYYIRLDISHEPGISYAKLTSIPPSVAIGEIGSLRYVEPRKLAK